ncbi:hypothetical protein [Spirosoma telluris]|uniref:hypothetical protein n=1 Tax=Spirosoma telluris TaxID=2183553 RepID=UPI002FC356C7
MHTLSNLYVAGFILFITLAFKQDIPPRLKLFLLIGQSNMAGRVSLKLKISRLIHVSGCSPKS